MGFCYGSPSRLRRDLRKTTEIFTKPLKYFKLISYYSQAGPLSPGLPGWLFTIDCPQFALSCFWNAFQFVLFSLPKMPSPQNIPLLAQRYISKNPFTISSSLFSNNPSLQSLFYYTLICVSLYCAFNLVQGCRWYLLN